MPAPSTEPPIPVSSAARMSYLIQPFLGGSLAVASLLIGLLVWRMAELPHPSKPAAEQSKLVRTEPAPPRQTVFVIEPPTERADVVEKVPIPDPQPDLKASAEVPSRRPEPSTTDQIFEKRLQTSEEQLRRELLTVPELRLIADEDVQQLRAREEIAVKNALKTAIAAVKSAPRVRVRDNPVGAAVQDLENALGREQMAVWDTIPGQRVARIESERQAGAVFTTAAQERVIYEFNRNLQQTMQLEAREAGLTLRFGSASELAPNVAAEVAELSTSLRAMGFVTRLGVPSPRRFLRENLATGAAIPPRRPGTPPARRIGQGKAVASPKSANPERVAATKTKAFEKWCDQNQVERLSGTVPTLMQMLQIENEPTRLLLVRELARVKNTASTPELADRAVMDLSPEVRRAAVAALSGRSSRHYLPILLRALRYPWPPVADHAAVALRTLKPREAVGSLVDLLDLPSPSLPVFDTKSRHYAVREMVRLSHQRNCLLCHPASANKEDGLVRGVVPTPGKPQQRPISGGNYYSAVRGDFVRADITFLRQDFSLLLTEEDGMRRPSLERYDFVTRLRSVPTAANESASLADYPQRNAVLYALRGITGKDGGDSSDKWRELVGITAQAPEKSKDDSVEKSSKPPKD